MEDNWYSEALEVLTPLRYHGWLLVHNQHRVPHTDRLVLVPKEKLDELESALQKVEEFFTGPE